MWEDVIGGRVNHPINGVTLAGWPTFRNWLISESPDEAALLGSMIHRHSTRGKHELSDPLGYLKSMTASNDSYMLAGYALWRLQHVPVDGEIEDVGSQPDWSFKGDFGW
jgi:hypothetical protein